MSFTNIEMEETPTFFNRKYSLPVSDEEWKRLYQFQVNFRSKNKVTASDLLVNLELPLSLLHYLYSDLVRPSNKIGTLGKSWQLKNSWGKRRPSCDFRSGQEPEFVLRDIYEFNKEKFGSFGVDSIRISDDSNSVIIGTTPSWGIALNQDAVKSLLEGTQFEEFPILVETFRLLSVLDSPICTWPNAVRNNDVVFVN